MLEIWLAFSAGVAGSGHCLGMCGGIVAALAVAGPGTTAGARLGFSLGYHAGRITTYTLLGLLAGLASQAEAIGTLRPALQWLFLAANLFVVLIGLATACGLQRIGIAALDRSGRGVLQRALTRAAGRSTAAAAFPAGLAMGLLPCGLVYGILISAATSGSWLTGAGMLLAFGLGTLPALVAYGQVAAALTGLGSGLFQRFMGLAVAFLGLAGVWKALVKLGLHH